MNNSVLFAASECSPYVRADEMADFVSALPKALHDKNWDIRVVLPGYSCLDPDFRASFAKICEFRVTCGEHIKEQYAGVLQAKISGITYYLIDSEYYFTGDYPYKGLDLDIDKYTFFCKAVLQMLSEISYVPSVLHCNDWETSLIPVYLKTVFAGDPTYQGIHTVFTIHNLQYQAICEITDAKNATGLPDDLFTVDKLEFHGKCNLLKAGLVYADYITTNSESYNYEVQTDVYGAGLSGLLSARHMQMQGILTGIYNECYDPASDSFLPFRYDCESVTEARRRNKEALQKELHLWENRDLFFIMMHMPLDNQYGMDLIGNALEGMLDSFTQIVFVGKGLPVYEDMIRNFQWRYPNQVRYAAEYDDSFYHRLLGAADAYVYPARHSASLSRIMAAKRYGVLPIIHEAGSLRDIVSPFNIYENTGDGFSFRNYKPEELLYMINYAKQIYFDRPSFWHAMVLRGMQAGYTWEMTAQRYADLYHFLMEN